MVDRAALKTGRPGTQASEPIATAPGGYGIGDVVALTGVAESTLRMWERRHGFPAPQRLPSGHRRYGERDVDLVRQVLAERAAGRSLAAAIERVRGTGEPSIPSIFATLRSRRPDLEPRPLRKRIVSALTHAIEDEALSRAERTLLFGAFQRERFYRQAERRWREVTARAEVAIAYADFSEVRVSPDAPAEIPVGAAHPMSREWALICDAESYSVCISAWEPPISSAAPEAGRFFETIWSVEPSVVREAAAICAGVAAPHAPDLAAGALARLESRHEVVLDRQLQLATAITNRTLTYLS